MAAFGGKLYVTGGYDGRNTHLKSAEVLDLATMEWSALPDMADPRDGHGQCLDWVDALF